jgi:nicotinate-nucleotide--dimethylbenzimidazole phosphoribosyltransferase
MTAAGPAVPAVDTASRAAALAHLDQLTKPQGSLGRLEEIVVWAAGVQGQSPPSQFGQPRLVIVAGDHGVAREARTSAYPPEVTAQMVGNLLTGGAAANALARRNDVGVRVVDACVDSDYEGIPVPPGFSANRIRRGNAPIQREDAVTRDERDAALLLGSDLADEEIDSGADLLIVGDMGIGNTTPAAALIATFTESDAATVCGRGTGIDDETWMRKAAAIRDALWRSRGIGDDPWLVVQTVGGADLAVMTAILLRAAQRGIPAILDGMVVTSAALVAAAIDPGATAWWLAGHRSVEPAHTIALRSLALQPVLDLGMRLGEGSGALVALAVVQQALIVSAEMATFSDAGVSDRDHDAGTDA